MGYPAVVIEAEGERVDGFVFSSDNLTARWSSLDEFEGDAYHRVEHEVYLSDGSQVSAWVCELRSIPGDN